MISAPQIKKLMNKKVLLTLNNDNNNNKIAGVLRGYDNFLNLVIDDAIEILNNDTKNNLGPQSVIRGNCIVSLEPLDTVS